MLNSEQKKFYISYPGLSEELVIDKNTLKCQQFFEIVSSCGVFCGMPESMQIRLLQAIRDAALPITGIIFVTDELNKEKIEKVVGAASDVTHVVTFKDSFNINRYGLRVHSSEFTDEEKFKELIRQNPNHLVLVSTPYSCPDLWKLITDEDTIANRSSLFFFENKKVYSKWFKKEMNFIGEYNHDHFEKLSDFFNDAPPEDVYFLKALGDFTGGSSVIPLTREAFALNQIRIKALLEHGTYYLFKKTDSLNIRSPKGEHQGTQFRLFIDASGKPAGFALKFSAEVSLHQYKRTSLRQLNLLFNSSSGNATSILFENQGGVLKAVKLSLSKKNMIYDSEVIENYLKNIYLGDFSLSNQADLVTVMNILEPKANEMRTFFNTFFFEQTWDTLYKSFLISKKYFGENDAE